MSTKNSLKQRDYLFDNCKTLLIILVVIGHFIEPSTGNTEFLRTLKWLIFSFHMPAFIFISGYFSKRDLPLSVVIRKLAVPYLVYEIIYYLFYTFIMHKETGLYLLRPKFSLWYLLALFVWRVITPYVKKIPCFLPVSIACGLLIGLSDMPDNFLSIPRILYFYPFFLAGISMNRDMITKLRNNAMKVVSLTGAVLFTLFFAFSPACHTLSPKVFYGRYNYESLGLGITEGILTRLICYGIGFAMTFILMILMTEHRTFYSYIGTRTTSLYLFHGLTYSYLKDCTTLLHNIDTVTETALLLAFCLALSAFFSVAQFTTFTNAVADIHLPDVPEFRRWTRRRLAYFRWNLRMWKPDFMRFYRLLYNYSQI